MYIETNNSYGITETHLLKIFRIRKSFTGISSFIFSYSSDNIHCAHVICNLYSKSVFGNPSSHNTRSVIIHIYMHLYDTQTDYKFQTQNRRRQVTIMQGRFTCIL